MVLVVQLKRGFGREIDVRSRGLKYVELLQKRLTRRARDLSANIGQSVWMQEALRIHCLGRHAHFPLAKETHDHVIYLKPHWST